MALVTWSAHKLPEAMAELREAIRFNPTCAKAHNALGTLRYDQGKQEEAAAEERTAIELDPKSADPHNNLGN